MNKFKHDILLRIVKSVIVPLVVPFTTTEAPITDSPVASFTSPLHIPACCVVAKEFAPEAVAVEIVPENKVPRNNTILTDCSLFNIILSFEVY